VAIRSVRHPDNMFGALARHDAIVRDAVESHGGRVVKTTDDGVHAVFANAGDSRSTPRSRPSSGCRRNRGATCRLRRSCGCRTLVRVRDLRLCRATLFGVMDLPNRAIRPNAPVAQVLDSSSEDQTEAFRDRTVPRHSQLGGNEWLRQDPATSGRTDDIARSCRVVRNPGSRTG
jgi:class 3 adenylate cyclase